MANEKVTQLPNVIQAFTSDIIYAVQAGVSVQETLAQVLTLMLSNTILHYPGNPNGNVAGQVYQLLWDTVGLTLYVCTSTGSASTAVWTVVTQPISGIVSPAHGGTGVANPAAHSLPVAEGASNFSFLGPLTDGQLLIGVSGANPSPALISAGANITVTNGAGSIQISAVGAPSVGWTEVTTATQTMSADAGYVANRGAGVVFTLPAVAAFGTVIYVVGKGSGGWTVNTGAGQSIVVGNQTAGTSVASSNGADVLFLLTTTANTVFTATSVIGNLTIV